MTNLKKKYFDCDFEVKSLNEDGTFEGYGSVFGNIDSYGDIVVKGAFDKSLKALKSKNRMPALLWQHKSSEPVGIFTDAYEDEIGLYVKGKLALKTVRGQEAYELMKMGAISGMSIGFIVNVEEYDSKNNTSLLKEIDLWEVSLVTFPSNDSARVSSVKSIDDCERMKDVESYLREAGGFSKKEAEGIIARIKSMDRGEPEKLDELIVALQSLESKFKGN
jgi:HK97 family phage prohead protease